MRRIAIIDTAYPQFLASLQFRYELGYEANLQSTLHASFGTHDSYSRALRELGWDAIDVIANHIPLQELWAHEHHLAGRLEKIAVHQIKSFGARVVFLQDLSFFSVSTLKDLGRDHVLAGQCSCALTDVAKVQCCDVIFSSFPYYVQKLDALGVHCVYLPLAFDPIVFDRLNLPIVYRSIGCSFVGGFGRQWTTTEKVMEAVASQIPESQFWGYGKEHAPVAVQAKHQGEAWGLGMYRILANSKIVLNRHGAISQGYSNNLRLFEASGMGAMVVTEESHNLREFFSEDEMVSYRTPAEAVEKIRYYLDHDDERAAIAQKGQQRTLKNHTYSTRMPKVSAILEKAA